MTKKTDKTTRFPVPTAVGLGLAGGVFFVAVKNKFVGSALRVAPRLMYTSCAASATAIASSPLTPVVLCMMVGSGLYFCYGGRFRGYFSSLSLAEDKELEKLKQSVNQSIESFKKISDEIAKIASEAAAIQELEVVEGASLETLMLQKEQLENDLQATWHVVLKKLKLLSADATMFEQEILQFLANAGMSKSELDAFNRLQSNHRP